MVNKLDRFVRGEGDGITLYLCFTDDKSCAYSHAMKVDTISGLFVKKMLDPNNSHLGEYTAEIAKNDGTVIGPFQLSERQSMELHRVIFRGSLNVGL